jgi:hypothetical protein
MTAGHHGDAPTLGSGLEEIFRCLGDPLDLFVRLLQLQLDQLAPDDTIFDKSAKQ